MFLRPALASFLGLLLLSACDRPAPEPAPRPPSDSPNVLLITLDTTRADHLGCYGHAAAQTPTLDALAAAGVRFEQAFCQVPLTLPSHTSLLTGTYPPTNGIRVNGGGVLSNDVPTVAEVFGAHHYRTGAFIGAWVLNAAFGLDRGFDVYDDNVGGDAVAFAVEQERPADRVCDAALAWLDEQPDTPFFAWVHFFDPHQPYEPPPPYRARLADPYDGEIAFSDAQVQRLVQWLETHHCRQQALIIIAADHGEAFGEHGETSHGLFLYDTTIRVPLIFSFPSRLPQGKVVGAGARLIDVVPTILDLLGWEPTPGTQGRSLRPALEASAFAFLPAYSETEYTKVGFGWAGTRSYTTEQWKYIAAPDPELYDRPADPGELANLIDKRPDVAARLQNELNALLTGMPKRQAERVTLDDKARRTLESLGYVEAGAPPAEPPAGQARRDPKDMLAVYHGLMAAKQMIEQRRYVEAAQLLQPLVAQSPESDELHAALGEAYLKLGRLKDAEQEYRASLRSLPTNPRRLCRLGDTLYRQGRTPEAIKCYERSMSTLADYGPAHNRLGSIYFQQQRFAEAGQHFRRQLEIDPTASDAMTNLASVLLETGQRAEAERLLHQALQQNPTFAPAYRSLCQMLLRARRRTEAINTLRAACRALPRDIPMKRQLAMLLATTPQAGPNAPQEAVSLGKACCQADRQNPENFDVLGMAYAAGGDFARAIEAARHAMSLAQSQGKLELAARIAVRLQAYQARRTP